MPSRSSKKTENQWGQRESMGSVSLICTHSQAPAWECSLGSSSFQSGFAKLELRVLGSQAGAWEPAQKPRNPQGVGRFFYAYLLLQLWSKTALDVLVFEQPMSKAIGLQLNSKRKKPEGEAASYQRYSCAFLNFITLLSSLGTP